jgi:hypothetical protein
MNKLLRIQCLEFRSVLLVCLSELFLLLTFSALGLWVIRWMA